MAETGATESPALATTTAAPINNIRNAVMIDTIRRWIICTSYFLDPGGHFGRRRDPTESAMPCAAEACLELSNQFYQTLS